MNRIDKRFTELKSAARTGLIPFITAGDPSPDGVVPLMHALVEGGADVIELGVPFSDPMADGPVIQHASERALAKGVGLAQILGWVGEFRRTDTDTPIVLMGYLNPVEIHGYARFAHEAVAAGVDGVLLVDCPLEESATIKPLAEAGLHRILLAAPTTHDARLVALTKESSGFLYYVSFAGVTGANRLDLAPLRARVAAIKQLAPALPVAVGFGVRDAASAVAIAEFADAVVIGSALVECLARSAAGQAAAAARTFLAPIRAALDGRVGRHAA